MIVHVRHIDLKSDHDGNILTVWTDKHLNESEVEALSQWLHKEGYVEGRTRVRINQLIRNTKKTYALHISFELALILVFLWLMSMAACYIFSAR